MNPVLVVQGIARAVLTSGSNPLSQFSNEKLTPEEHAELQVQIQADRLEYGSAWGIFGPILGAAVAFVVLLAFLLH
jgi:hypothetical protein